MSRKKLVKVILGIIKILVVAALFIFVLSFTVAFLGWYTGAPLPVD